MKYLQLTIVLAMLVSISGCGGGKVTKISAPSGASMYKVKCKDTPAECLEQAYIACDGGPYTTIYSDAHAGGLLADLIPGPITWYNLTFQCGGSGRSKPSFRWTGAKGDELIKMGQEIYKNSTPPPKTRTSCVPVGNTVQCTSY